MPLFGRSRKAADNADAAPFPPDETAPVEEDRPVPEPTMSVDEYRAYLLSRIAPMQPFGVDILAAVGLPLCETIRSDFDVPHFDAAAVVGYGVRAEDVRGAHAATPVSLAVVGQVESGAIAEDALAPRTAMLLAAGAPVPAGVDTVVPLEDTDGGMVDVTIRRACDVGEGIRRKGADIAEGDVIASRDERVTPSTLGVLAGIGIDRILVRPRPRVIVLPFAKDMVEPGLPLVHRGESYDAASWFVSAAAREAGALSVHVGTDLSGAVSLRQVLADQLIRADLLITVGGNEPGGILRDVLTDSDEPAFVDVDLAPGRDHGFVMVDGAVPMLMLPAGLVAAAVGFTLFAEPVLRRLQGRPEEADTVPAVSERLLVPEVEGRTSYVPVRVVDGQAVRAGDPHTELQALRDADGLAVVSEQIAAGADVTVLPWRTGER